jgi:hypothetical protein
MELVIFRPKQFVDRARAYILSIDGKPIAKLKAGEEIKIDVPENAKILSASIDWCSSNDFLLSGICNNQKIEVKNSISRKIWIPLYILYAITLKRKSYLNIATAT